MQKDLKVEINGKKIRAPLKNKWLVLTPEEKVRQEYICHLVNHYGFTLEQMTQEIQVNNSKRGQGQARADIVIWKNSKDKVESNSPIIVVECKADNITIHEDDYFQGSNYATWAGADFFVTTNLKETRFFKINKGKIPKKLDEVVNIPDAKTITNEKKIKELLQQTKSFTRDEFSKLLFKCHNIIRNNDKLSPEAAFDEISKILFIKIRYERNTTGGQIFSKEQFEELKEAYDKTKSKSSPDFYQQLFERTKEDFKEDDLFENNEIIRIRENSFESIVKELEIYNLSKTADDVKGIAFEKFLGRTFRGELGQFFTPRTVVDFITDILDPEENELICDPCCGSGGFLIKAFEYVRTKIEKEVHLAKEKIKEQFFNEDYEKLSEKAKSEVDEKVSKLISKVSQELEIRTMGKSRLKSLSYDCIFGVDANPRMSRTAKMNMIMHGDGHGGVHHNDGLLNVNGIFENRFDVIMTNPPFGSRVEKSLIITEADKYKDIERIKNYKERYGKAYDIALEQINNNINKPVLDLYETGSMSTLTEVLFIERCLNLLKPGGRMGIVLPEGILNNPNLQKIRDYVESRAKILLIVSIPQEVFIASGATIKPSLLFFKKFTEEEAKQYNEIKIKAENEVNEKYEVNIQSISNQLAKKGKDAPSVIEKKKLRLELKQLQEQIAMEIKIQIKKDFNYQIPIAEVEKAGISSTGASADNELVPLAKEFEEYRYSNKLWKNNSIYIDYQVDGEKIFRIKKKGHEVLENEELMVDING
ncbi:N-6 DNA methylase [Acinetobacter indicus]|uniref:N-6 DNA methylase n=1 Tax=Acinetobacter indicus TaxID=756892 RepID=UPI002578A657|nr:N-6 DNA methylase [Acinetobacter indicus]MDM1301429.1 N-6 DNA methylase [Acinetobacter indicus]